MKIAHETARIVRAMKRLDLPEDRVRTLVEQAFAKGKSPKDVERALRQHVQKHTGLIQRQKSRKLGVWVSVYEAEKGGFDPDGGPYVTICEAHSTICNHNTLKLALAHAPHVEWCEECMDAH